uniref:Insulin-like growth factor 1 receptor (inferred by orthology to a human protein) n=1 Tax=Strongyloides venezuelensis TaxID=75913 RepID=A0A0K0FPW2_STRVS
MLTLVQQTYAALDNPEVFEYNVKPRKVLSGLQGCADFWHHTMKHCWRYNPVENHLEVIDEDDKSENVFLDRPKKHVRIPTPDNNA